MTPATTTCDACGKRFAFTSHKDRCPVCYPVQSRDDDEPDNDYPPDEEYDDD